MSATGVTTGFLYDGADMIAEYNSSNALLRRYVFGPGVDEALVWYEGAGTSDRRYLVADERGSIVAVTNASGAASGSGFGINTYDEYGTPGPSNLGRFQYTGQAWLPEAQLYHYKARAYSPSLGRFLQTDPIGFGGGMNLYAYVGNDPVNAIDPSGLRDWRSRCITCTMAINHSPRGSGNGTAGSSDNGTLQGTDSEGSRWYIQEEVNGEGQWLVLAQGGRDFGHGGFTMGLGGMVASGTNESGGWGGEEGGRPAREDFANSRGQCERNLAFAGAVVGGAAGVGLFLGAAPAAASVLTIAVLAGTAAYFTPALEAGAFTGFVAGGFGAAITSSFSPTLGVVGVTAAVTGALGNHVGASLGALIC